MSKPCFKISLLNQSKICQDSKNPFSKNKVHYSNKPNNILNNSACEKISPLPNTLNESLHRVRSYSNEFNTMLGKLLNKASHIDDSLQREFANIANIGPIDLKLSYIKVPRDGNKKLLVLDMEDIIMHEIDFRNTEIYSKIQINPKSIKTLSYYNPNKKTFIFNKIILRPYLEYFLTVLKPFYRIVVFFS